MKTNHRVWPADSASCAGSKLTDLQHVALQQRGLHGASLNAPPHRQTEQEKKRAVKATIKGSWSGSSFQRHCVRVRLFIFFNGERRFSKTPSRDTLAVWMALFHTSLSSESKVQHWGLFSCVHACFVCWQKPVCTHALVLVCHKNAFKSDQ